MQSSAGKELTLKSISENVTAAEYAVRGELLLRAQEHEKVLQEWRNLKQKDNATQPCPLPFEEIIYCNIGNPQALEQKPVTYFRQLLSLLEYPQLMDSPHIGSIFPSDVIQRAKQSLAKIKGGTGAYSHSQGIPFIRSDIADFISRRDGGIPSNPDNIFLYNGASPAVQTVLQLLIRNKEDGILVPIPQYPLYSASIRLCGGSLIGYYLQESSGWGLEISELERAYNEAVQSGIKVRAIVVINPGNPTGQVLPEENIKQIIEFCHKKRLVVLADEVYQENVYISEKKFYSFKKALMTLGDIYSSSVELFSFHSISKGFTGECGHRGGYLEAVNIDTDILSQMYKLSSINLCPNTSGQILMDLMVNPPKEGEESYPLYVQETQNIKESLKRRALKLTKFLDSLEGVSCNAAEGAMYAFPTVNLPAKAVEKARSLGKKPDEFYAIEVLDHTGLCVVPGSGFGQKDGTWHFRTTFLPSEDKIDSVLVKLGDFHSKFMKEFN